MYSTTSRIDFMNAGSQHEDTNTCNIVWHRLSDIVKNLSGLSLILQLLLPYATSSVNLEAGGMGTRLSI